MAGKVVLGCDDLNHDLKFICWYTSRTNDHKGDIILNEAVMSDVTPREEAWSTSSRGIWRSG